MFQGVDEEWEDDEDAEAAKGGFDISRRYRPACNTPEVDIADKCVGYI